MTAVRVHASDVRAVDLALVAVAAADAWCNGNGLPRPRAWPARRILAACRKAGARHHLAVTGGYYARAVAALDALASAVNAEPEPQRAATLCAVLLDLLNDRAEPAFAAVSHELTRLDGELPRGEGVECAAARIADSVRDAFAREVE